MERNYKSRPASCNTHYLEPKPNQTQTSQNKARKTKQNKTTNPPTKRSKLFSLGEGLDSSEVPQDEDVVDNL